MSCEFVPAVGAAGGLNYLRKDGSVMVEEVIKDERFISLKVILAEKNGGV